MCWQSKYSHVGRSRNVRRTALLFFWPVLSFVPALHSLLPPSFLTGGFVGASPSPAFALVPPGPLQALPWAAALQGKLLQLSRGCSSSVGIRLLCRGAFLRLQQMPAPAAGPPPSPCPWGFLVSSLFTFCSSSISLAFVAHELPS